jgi:Ca-activated chloride channel family protein
MKLKLSLSLAFIYTLFFLVPGARADGIIVPDPPICDGRPCFDPGFPIPMAQLEIRYHHVTVTIEDQVAITRVDQVFYNPNDWTVEGTYIFPLPLDAAVSGFRLWIDGEPVEGEVLDADQARRTYEEIVRQLIDPALLEYAEQGAVRARIFPIPAGGDRRIELEYTQALAAENGLVKYQYPLNTEKFSASLLDEVRVSVDVRSRTPIRAIYSPSHPVDIVWDTKEHVRAGYEETNVRPDTDFTLYYSLGETEAFHLLTYRDASDPADPDGFFLLLLAPRPDAGERTLPKDVLLVLDRSGSMEGEKFRQAQSALGFILQNLNPEDRFNVITFSTGLDSFARRLQPVSEVSEALDWVDRLSAGGSTDINRALLEAVSFTDRERPAYLIFLTDGLPTEGVANSQQILDNVAFNAPANLRLFSFGVGYDVDTFLLDSLAQAHHGTSTYVVPGERLDENISAFYEKISTPVLTDLTLDFGDIAAFDIYPSPLPDLFVGSQIILVGRYRAGGVATVTLQGEVEGRTETFRFPEQVFARDSREDGAFLTALPRLWATRKIGGLLNQVRLQGPDEETIDQIVRLSIRYGIVTPYTSYLVTEPMPLGAAAQDQIVSEEMDALEAKPAEPSFGQSAVERAAAQGDLAEAEAPVPFAEKGIGEIVRIVGARTFVNAEGVWIDTAFDPEAMTTTPVAFLSPNYFALLQARPELAPAFALGGRVIAFADGMVYEVVPSDTAVEPLEVPPTPELIAGTALPTVNPTPTPAPTVPPAPGSVPGCLGGLLPLAIIPLGIFQFRRRLKK